jgi:thiol:disulfide interchange protein
LGRVREGAQLALAKPIDSSHEAAGWQTYSPDAVKQALAQNRPAFVDFTAAWCLSCKVNEAVALDIASTKQAFAEKHVALFRGDWTHSDPQITETLRHYNRDGVPLYLLYSPKNPDSPKILPAVLTPEIVQNAVLGHEEVSTKPLVLWCVLALVLLALLVFVWASRTNSVRRAEALLQKR